jgi:hypothetical protein
VYAVVTGQAGGAERMTCQLLALCIDANDPLRLARFWSGVLGWELAGDSSGGVSLVPGDDAGLRIRFLPAQETNPGLNLGHLHLASTSLEDQQQTVARSLGLGARHVDIGQRPEEGHIVLADAEGNNFCVIEPGNNWLADCGFLAELTCDGSREAGYFWSRALGWPLVWDQGLQTAIRSPHGGPKISWDSWDGAGMMPKAGPWPIPMAAGFACCPRDNPARAPRLQQHALAASHQPHGDHAQRGMN